MVRARTTSRARERWDEDEARRALDECERSGKSVHAFASEHGITAQRLYYWRKRLADPVVGAEALSLVPAQITGNHGSGCCAVRLPSGLAIEVVDASPSWVAALVRELQSEP